MNADGGDGGQSAGNERDLNPNVVWQASKVSREQRPHRGGTLWITGLSGSGKSSVAIELERRLVTQGRPAYLMDGDNLRPVSYTHLTLPTIYSV